MTTTSNNLLLSLSNNDNQFTSVTLSSCNLDDTAIVALCTALQFNTHVVELNLSKNSFGIAGLYAIANLISVNHSLTKLDLSFNNLDARGCMSISRVLGASNISSMNLQNCGSNTGMILMAMMKQDNKSTTSTNSVTSTNSGSYGSVCQSQSTSNVTNERKRSCDESSDTEVSSVKRRNLTWIFGGAKV